MERVLVYLVIFICSFLSVNAQMVGTPYVVPVVNKPLLDELGLTPSFAFSSRKLREAYTGYAIRLRRATDNSQVDVSFDLNGVVSSNSIVTFVVVGTSGSSVGQTTSLSNYKGSNPLFVTIWYDQGVNGFHGVQSNTARQPIFNLSSAGVANQYSSLQFTGSSKHNVTVNQTMPVLLSNGLRGSLLFIAKVQAGVSTNNSFGHSDINNNNKRWSAHMNWPSDNLYMYTDLGSSSDLNRNFLNNSSAGFNVFKQYSIIRAINSKIVRVSAVNRNNSAQNITSISWSAGSTFGVGLTTGSLDSAFSQNGFTGSISEFVLFNTDLTATQYQLLEQNQLSFWGAN